MAMLFITGTGTEVGKTAVTTLLMAQLARAGRPARAVKPVHSGFDPSRAELTDAGVLLAASGQPVTLETLDATAPWRFVEPLSPDMAAAREGRAIDFQALVDWCKLAAAQHDGPLLIEGVGGAMVPIDQRRTVREWIAALEAPTVLISGSYLGAISHTLTAVTALEARGIEIRSILISTSRVNPVAPEETAETIERISRLPVRVIPRLTMSAEGLPELTDDVPDLSDLAP